MKAPLYENTHISPHTVNGLAIMHQLKGRQQNILTLKVFFLKISLHQIGNLKDTSCAKMLFTAIQDGAAREFV